MFDYRLGGWGIKKAKFLVMWYMDGSLIKQEYFTQPIEAHVQKHFVSICNQRPGKKLALEIEAGRIWKW